MHPRWSRYIPKHTPELRECFSTPLHVKNIFLIFFINRKFELKIEFFMLYSFTSIKNAFLRQRWQLTCLSFFHIMPNAARGVKYVTISNFSRSRFWIQGFILKKINFFQLLLPKCFKNKLKTFEKCLQKVDKIRKFFFLRNRF